MNPKDFGAVWDGVTDDTTAVQAALNRIAQLPAGSGALLIPTGIGRMTRQLIYSANTPLTIKGFGVENSILEWTSPGGFLVQVNSNKNSERSNTTTISDLTLSGRCPNAGDAISVQADDNWGDRSSLQIHNVSIRNGEAGAAYYTFGWNRGIYTIGGGGTAFRDVMISGFSSTSNIGVEMYNPNPSSNTGQPFDYYFQNVEISGFTTGFKARGHYEEFIFDHVGIGATYGFDIDAVPSQVASNPPGVNPLLVMVNCMISTVNFAVVIKRYSSVYIDNCDIFIAGTDGSNDHRAVFIERCLRVGITNCRVGGAGGTPTSISEIGIFLSLSENIRLVGNEVGFLNENGMYIFACRKCIISNNILGCEFTDYATGNRTKFTRVGVLLNQSQFVHCTNNLVVGSRAEAFTLLNGTSGELWFNATHSCASVYFIDSPTYNGGNPTINIQGNTA